MSYPPLGYSYPSAASTLASSQLLSNLTAATASGTAAAATTIATSCCETGRPIMTDPHTGQTVCSCQYNSSLLSYSRVAAGLPDGVYPTAYATQGYVPFGTDPSAFYSPLNSAYDLKDNTDAWRNLSQPTPCYPYDPTMAGYPYGSRSFDMNMGTYRKNATRETTSTLKAWLFEHKKNPYPTKGEKIMLAIITRLTLTQVSTWFANARRRLKKEGKHYPGSQGEDDDDDDDIDIKDDEKIDDDDIGGSVSEEEIDPGTDLDSSQDDILIKSNEEAKSDEDEKDGERTTTTTSRCLSPGGGALGGTTGLNQTSNHILPPPAALSSPSSSSSSSLSSQTSPGHTLGGSGIIHHQHLGNNNQISSHPSSTSPVQLTSNSMNNSQKPRIWSLAHTATSSSPPLGRRSPPSMPIHVTPKHHSGQGSGGYHSAMSTLNSLRQWVDGNGFSTSVSSHPGLSLPSHPAYGLTAHTMSTSSQSSATITSPSNQVDTPPATPPTAHSRPPGGYPVHMSMGHTLGYPSAGTFSKLSNGLPTRLPGVDARDLSDMKSDAAKALDRDERTKTAFKPVTKSKFGEVVKV